VVPLLLNITSALNLPVFISSVLKKLIGRKGIFLISSTAEGVFPRAFT
jgi:hypothetical protein